MGLFDGKKPAKPLRLMADDAEDMPAVSALLQDAVLRAADMVYDPAGRHFTLRINRFCHEVAGQGALRAPSVVRVSCVTGVRSRGLDLGRKDQVLSLLDLAVEPGEAPACALVLRFAGGGDVRIDVECLDVLVLDLAAPRRAKSTPNHS